MSVLSFNFLTLELKKHNWRDYIKSKNPAAAALLSKMGYHENEKVYVKLEFLRMLVNMELDPARMMLLTGFFETYLRLNETEERILEKEIGKIDQKEADKMIELTTSWEEKGKTKGRIEGKIEGQTTILIKLLKKKFVNIPADIDTQVKTLSEAKLQQLAEAIFDLETMDDVRNFLRGQVAEL